MPPEEVSRALYAEKQEKMNSTEPTYEELHTYTVIWSYGGTPMSRERVWGYSPEAVKIAMNSIREDAVIYAIVEGHW